MSKVPIIPAAAVAAILASGQAPASWDAGPTNAIVDGIGYRSNLMDPRNPYASSERRNFGVLLARLGMIEDWTDIGTAAAAPMRVAPSPSYRDDVTILEDEEYTSYLPGVIAPHLLDDLFPFKPNYTYCSLSSHGTTQRYIHALLSARAPHVMRARLIAARHRLVPSQGECLAPDSLAGYLEALRGIDGPQWRPWRDYLEGAAQFHAEDYDSAARAFARIPQTDTWLGATAAYMLVRTAFRQLRAHEADSYWSENEDREERDAHWRRLADAIEDFVRSRLDWGYRNDVLHLRMYAARTSREPERAAPLYTSELARHFGPGRDAGMASSLYVQFINPEVWGITVGVAWDNPLWQVNRLLAALVQTDRHRKAPSWLRHRGTPRIAVDKAAATLAASIASGDAAFDAYPGLGVYAQALVTFAREDYERVIATVPSATAGAEHFLPDLLLLKARSQAALGNHWDAAMTWRESALRWPVLNAVGEAGRAAVKAGRFADFARLDWDLTESPDGRDWRSIGYDELANQFLGTEFLLYPPWAAGRSDPDYKLAGPARFLDAKRPTHQVLREGLARFTAPERSIEIARDSSFSPALRWYALEPLLQASLVGGDYQAHMNLSELTVELHRELEARAAPWWQGPEALWRWRAIAPIARKLAQDAGDPESLMTVGYFLYSKHIHPVCEHETTLWSRELDHCTNEGPGWSRGEAPIDMFERARAMFERRRTRSDAEGRLLRMMIYCYRSETNRASCLRGSGTGAERKVRAGWFRRLHAHFPKSARKTPYWW